MNTVSSLFNARIISSSLFVVLMIDQLHCTLLKTVRRALTRHSRIVLHCIALYCIV